MNRSQNSPAGVIGAAGLCAFLVFSAGASSRAVAAEFKARNGATAEADKKPDREVLITFQNGPSSTDFVRTRTRSGYQISAVDSASGEILWEREIPSKSPPTLEMAYGGRLVPLTLDMLSRPIQELKSRELTARNVPKLHAPQSEFILYISASLQLKPFNEFRLPAGVCSQTLAVDYATGRTVYQQVDIPGSTEDPNTFGGQLLGTIRWYDGISSAPLRTVDTYTLPVTSEGYRFTQTTETVVLDDRVRVFNYPAPKAGSPWYYVRLQGYDNHLGPGEFTVGPEELKGMLDLSSGFGPTVFTRSGNR
ncbi:MAG: hypothetical protein K1X83_13710 [Oligoflexia bacterium]|nr:hypothetical protein [Oligoflexia bacterium]